jgi:hypothetical protein
MRTKVFKWLLIIAALLFADWLIMIFFGCVSGLCRAGMNFFCSVYCFAGIILLSFTVLIIGYLIFRPFFEEKVHHNE